MHFFRDGGVGSVLASSWMPYTLRVCVRRCLALTKKSLFLEAPLLLCPAKMPTTDTLLALNQALDNAALLDNDLALIIKQIGYPAPRKRENSFATLMQIIVSQQLSTQAAAAIWSRVAALFPDGVEATRVLAVNDQALRDCGLSWRKVAYSQALATQIHENKLDLVRLATQDLETIVSALVKIKGFGRWSAEIYAMFALGHPDVFPAADLALQVAAGKIKGMKDRPTEKQTREIAKQWSPHQSSVALLLWHYYGSTTLN